MYLAKALRNIGKLHMSEYILNPTNYNPETVDYFKIPAELRDSLTTLYNATQIEAIQKSLRKNGITLIQGPPGTGKTFTILGIISVLINSHEEDGVSLLPPLELVRLSSRSSSVVSMEKIKKRALDPKVASLREIKRRGMPWLSNPNYTAE